ncbi:MAG: alcohol dehydrogenase catalytic domain-containing protein [Acidobacteria bacterium]|nr:alcohol dehydrogenase catalytic domain-containing protein [Acidobacteriota bacterium]MCA1642428.1 alcohol dehydrogenase catalytic domain-containing protein [Acidobacteriota bacterium]
MRALRYENDSLRVADVGMPRAEGEALVRVSLSGICNTDLEIARGYAGFRGTLGHEFVGVVEEAEGAGVLVGRRVVGEINAGCGRCALFAAGDPRHCAARTVLGIVGRDGAHAEYLRLPASNLLVVPDEISDERAVFTEPLAAACGIMERVDVEDGARVAVVGDGKLGLLCAQALAALSGASVTLVGKHESKLGIARRRGVETLRLDQLKGSTSARAFDVVVEASGSPSGFDLALSLLRPRGTLVLKSTFHGSTAFDSARVVVDEITVVGSRCGRFAPALELLKSNRVDVESLISEERPLADGVRAMARASEGGVMKVLLRP